jgi:hypothetical protein
MLGWGPIMLDKHLNDDQGFGAHRKLAFLSGLLSIHFEHAPAYGMET